MNTQLQTILDFIQQNEKLTAEEKDALIKAVKKADNDFTISEFKLERTEKVKRTTAILLEETIEELEQKRKSVEQQNRELEIESALERVRTVAMGMNKADDLLDICEVLFKELQKLGFSELRNAMINIHNDEKESFLNYDFSDFAGAVIANVDYNIYPSIQTLVKQSRSSKEAFIEYVYTGQELKDWKEFRKKNGEYDDPRVENITSLYYYFYSIGIGSIGISAFSAIGAERLELLKRFRNVFDLAYRRYIDITKAEAQAREAKIEAALERTRTQSMIMQHSRELDDTLRVFHEQVLLLGIHSAFSFLWLPDEGKDRHIFWAAWEEHKNGSTVFKSKAINYPLDRNEPATAQCFVDWKGNEPIVSYHVPPTGVESYFAAWQELIAGVEELKPENFSDGLYYVEAFIKYGCFGVMVRSELPDDEKKILGRLAIEFERAYTRFLDLQKAEAQAREAQIEAALEKVRSRTLAMQRSDELAETSAVLFQQLIYLGIEPNRLYIGIAEDSSTDIEFWITDEDGSKVSTMFKGDAAKNASMKKMYDGWKQQKRSLILDMQGKELSDYFHYLGKELHVPFKAGLSQKRRWQYIAYFSKGFIGMASPEEQPAETLQLLERFAYAFNLTFTRFNDLKVAEVHALQAEQDLIEIKAARKKAEDTLVELQSTQKQLIQSEKMASLGELTAGIAHEIQNPLNFVNNFSDVSNELLDEMKAELDNGNIEDAKSIADDVKQNLEKILHHGKRADGIVKGMLQHSRSSSGVKESTDINALADEYLRLAYHGLRAKDKSFNAAMKTDYDESIGLVKIMPQDMGRVILNLITNAFYAASLPSPENIGTSAGGFLESEKNKTPTVWVSTSKVPPLGGGVAGKILISVRDNGPGIPQKVLDKIFQPFFTTKPTGQGTGLGLSLSYDIVMAHGGEIKVETKEGEGTEFIISLPADN